MRRRICLVGAALSVCLLASVAGTAIAASGKSTGKATKVSCVTNTSITIASGDTDVLPPVAQGSEFGTASCDTMLGGGVQWDTFTVPTSGDTIGEVRPVLRHGNAPWNVRPDPAVQLAELPRR